MNALFAAPKIDVIMKQNRPLASLLILTTCIGNVMGQTQQRIVLNEITHKTTVTPNSEIVIFDDSDSENGYTSGCDYYIVIESALPNIATANAKSLCIKLADGSKFDIDNHDTLYIYDGSSTSAPILLKRNNSYSNVAGNVFFASQNNTSGKLTLRFKSAYTIPHSNTMHSGFEVTAAYCSPCEMVQPVIEPEFTRVNLRNGSTIGTKAMNYDSSGTMVASVCAGEGIIFRADVSNKSLGYDISSATFNWQIDNDTTITRIGKKTARHDRFGKKGLYNVTLSITNAQGCTSQPANMKVLVGHNLIQTISDLPDIALGDTAQVSAGYESASHTALLNHEKPTDYIGSNTHHLDIPDGQNHIPNVYSQKIHIDTFDPDDFITDPSQIEFVGIDMRHDFSGDLTIRLRCPSFSEKAQGESKLLHPNATNGGPSRLGYPGHDCEYYGWTIDSNYILASGENANTGCCYIWNTPSPQSEMIPPSDQYNKIGFYTPEDRFENLIGCPLNGDWILYIADFWSVDCGEVCSWSLKLKSNKTYPKYYADVDSVVWHPDTNFATDFMNGTYRGLSIWPSVEDSMAYYISPLDTTGTFGIILSVYDSYGCQWNKLTHITTIDTTHAISKSRYDAGLIFPTVVTPNGDGINDVFEIGSLFEKEELSECRLTVFDKNGYRIFHANNIVRPDQFWNPTQTHTPTGTYFYIFTAKSCQEKIEHNGTIEIIR